MKYALSELLPYKLSDKIRNEIQKGLEEYKLLLLKTQKALTHYEHQDYVQFDALVGENGCQTRAIKIALLAAKNEIDLLNFKSKVERVLNSINTLIKLNNNEIKKMGKTLEDIFRKENLELLLTKNEFFLVQAYILTLTKEYAPKMDIIHGANGNYYPLKKAKSISKKMLDPSSKFSNRFADNVSNKTKKYLSTFSVEFVQQLASEIKNPQLIKMVSDEFTFTHNVHLQCTPLFWSMKTLFLSVQKESLPVLLHAKFIYKENEELKQIAEKFLYVQQDPKGNCVYQCVKQAQNELTKPACVIQGVVCLDSPEDLCINTWEKTLKQYPLLDILLANCSVHGQYPNKVQDAIIHNLKLPEFCEYQRFGDLHGFTSNNPTTFLVQHIYAAIPEKVLAKQLM